MSTTAERPTSTPAKPIQDTDLQQRGSGGLRSVLYAIGSFSGLLVVWQAVIVVFDVNALLLPSVPDVFSTIRDSWAVLLDNARITLVEAVLGFALAVAVGVPLGIVITFSRRARTPSTPSWSRRR
jgi:ABC-type nitrate/sulfonate/bicarbonate transport system permease component